jgi:hypothetical protein
VRPQETVDLGITHHWEELGMGRAGQVVTQASFGIRELLGPAEGQYVVQAMLGTGPEGQSQNTGMDVYRFTSTEFCQEICFSIDWTPDEGRAVYALLYNTDCGGFYLENQDEDGTLYGCYDAGLPPGVYEVRIFNPLEDINEVSFPYTITVEASVPFSYQPFGNEVQPEENEPCGD